MTRSQSTWFRLRRSGLVTRFGSPERVAGNLIGIQAQLPSSAVLAAWNRAEGLTSDAFRESLAEHRSLVRLWGQRNTVHVYRTSDWPLLHAAFRDRAPLLNKRLEQNPAARRKFEATLRDVEGRLLQGETLAYGDLGDVDFGLGLDPWVAAYSVFLQLVREGVAVHAFSDERQTRFAHRSLWLPDLDWEPPDAHDANVEVARRYLRAYGPATAQDLAFWHGTTVARARRWLGALADETAEVEVEGTQALVLAEDLDELLQKPPSPSRWPSRLLHRFDPLLLATKDKSWLIDAKHYKEVWRPSAQVAAVMLVRGRIAGTWRYDRRAAGVRFFLKPFDVLSRTVTKSLEREAREIAGLLGSTVADFTQTAS